MRHTRPVRRWVAIIAVGCAALAGASVPAVGMWSDRFDVESTSVGQGQVGFVVTPGLLKTSSGDSAAITPDQAQSASTSDQQFEFTIANQDLPGPGGGQLYVPFTIQAFANGNAGLRFTVGDSTRVPGFTYKWLSRTYQSGNQTDYCNASDVGTDWNDVPLVEGEFFEVTPPLPAAEVATYSYCLVVERPVDRSYSNTATLSEATWANGVNVDGVSGTWEATIIPAEARGTGDYSFTISHQILRPGSP